eukprot:scaffold29832_cov112-Isochrysis_galbana.AAC.4
MPRTTRHSEPASHVHVSHTTANRRRDAVATAFRQRRALGRWVRQQCASDAAMHNCSRRCSACAQPVRWFMLAKSTSQSERAKMPTAGVGTV